VAEFEQRLSAGVSGVCSRLRWEYYGTPTAPVLEALQAGPRVILEIEIEGTIQVMRRFPDGNQFLHPGSDVEELQGRLVGRQKDSARRSQERLSKADAAKSLPYDSGVYRHFSGEPDGGETVDKSSGWSRRNRQHDRNIEDNTSSTCPAGDSSSPLLQKRWIELMQGARPTVDPNGKSEW